jgi:hypothetical protein
MKTLKELMIELEEDKLFERINTSPVESSILYGGDVLKHFKDKILETYEFSDVGEVELLDYPIVHDINGQSQTPKTYLLQGGEKIIGKAHILSIELTREVFKSENLHDNITDGASVSPKLYNEDTFKPFRQILLEYNPDKYKNEEWGSENLIRQELHDKVDEILENMEKYTAKGSRSILIRGFFEGIEKSPVKPREKFHSIVPEPKAYVAFYAEKVSDENGLTAKLKQKIIPAELRDDYLKQFGSRGIDVSGEEIEEFLSKHTT